MALEAKTTSTQRCCSDGTPIPEHAIAFIPLNAKSITKHDEWVTYQDDSYIVSIKYTGELDLASHDTRTRRNDWKKPLYDDNCNPLTSAILNFIQSNSHWVAVRRNGFSYYVGSVYIWVVYTDLYQQKLDRAAENARLSAAYHGSFGRCGI